jgi:hypothetical protein
VGLNGWPCVIVMGWGVHVMHVGNAFPDGLFCFCLFHVSTLTFGGCIYPISPFPGQMCKGLFEAAWGGKCAKGCLKQPKKSLSPASNSP